MKYNNLKLLIHSFVDFPMELIIAKQLINNGIKTTDQFNELMNTKDYEFYPSEKREKLYLAISNINSGVYNIDDIPILVL